MMRGPTNSPLSMRSRSAMFASAWSAAGEDRGVARLEQRLHLLGVEVVDVLVAVDEAGHRAHALGVDGAQPLRRRRASGDRDDLAAAHDDRARLDHLAAADDDPGVGDRHVLRRRRGRDDQNGAQARWYEDSCSSMLTPRAASARPGTRTIAVKAVRIVTLPLQLVCRSHEINAVTSSHSFEFRVGVPVAATRGFSAKATDRMVARRLLTGAQPPNN